MGDDATQNHGRYSQPCALFPSVANIAVHCRTIKEANALDLMETDMTMRLAIVLACTLLGLSACVVEPYGRGGEAMCLLRTRGVELPAITTAATVDTAIITAVAATETMASATAINVGPVHALTGIGSAMRNASWRGPTNAI